MLYEDLLAAHEKWLLDYNHQRHMAHEQRDDTCHSPAAVLNWQRGMQPAPELIYPAFSAIGETRVLNKAGYAKFRNFLLYGEQGLAGRETLLNSPCLTCRNWFVLIVETVQTGSLDHPMQYIGWSSELISFEAALDPVRYLQTSPGPPRVQDA